MSDILDRIPDGYTPGPWRLDEMDEMDCSICAGPDDSGVYVADCAAYEESDLQVILLAPELADAVRSLTAERDDWKAKAVSMKAGRDFLASEDKRQIRTLESLAAERDAAIAERDALKLALDLANAELSSYTMTVETAPTDTKREQ